MTLRTSPVLVFKIVQDLRLLIGGILLKRDKKRQPGLPLKSTN